MYVFFIHAFILIYLSLPKPKHPIAAYHLNLLLCFRTNNIYYTPFPFPAVFSGPSAPYHTARGRGFFVQLAVKEQMLFDMSVFCMTALRFVRNPAIITYKKGSA